MNINKVLKLGVLFAVLTLILSVSGIAQTFVSATNGDDRFGTGSQASPYRSITKAISVLAGTGGTISVEAGIYNNALTNETVPVTISAGKTFTFVGTAVGVNTTVSIPDGFVVNASGAVVNIGQSGSAGFTVGTVFTLAAGSVNIATGTAASGLTLSNGVAMTIGDGTLNTVPALGGLLNVTFSGANAVSSTSAFLPANLNGGSLTINKATGSITIDNAALTAGAIAINNVADVNISSNVTLSGALSTTTGAAANINITGNVSAAAGVVVNGAVATTLSMSGNLTLGSATAGAAADLVNNGTGTITVGTTSGNTVTLYTTVDAAHNANTAYVGQIINAGTGAIVVNATVNANIKNTGTSTNGGEQNAETVSTTLPLISQLGATPAAITINGPVNFINTNVVGSTTSTNQNAHTVSVSNQGTGSLTFNGTISTPNSTAGFATPANVYVNVAVSNLGGGSFSTRAAALRGTAVEGISNKTVAGGSMTLGQVGDAVSATWNIMNDLAGSTLTLNGTGALAGALTNNNATSKVVLGASQTIAGAVTNNGIIQLGSNTLTLSFSSPTFATATLSGNGDIFSNTSATTGSGLVKFTGDYVLDTYSGNLPNVEVASAKWASFWGNVVYGNLVKSGAATMTDSSATDVKGFFTMSGAGLVTFKGVTTVRGDVNMNAGSITLANNLTVEGTVNIPQGTFSFGSNTLTLKGNFNRTGGTIDAAAAGSGTLVFNGPVSQTFTPGTQMNVGSVVVNNQGQYVPGFVTDQNIVNITGSLVVLKDFTITKGLVTLGLNNIRMEQSVAAGNSARFTNNDRGYTATGVGGIIFEGAGANNNGDGDGAVITGTQPFSNIYVRLTTPANNVYCLGPVVISGTVTLDGGGIIWNAPNEPAEVADNFTASTLTLNQTLTGAAYPTVVINTVNTHGSPFLVDGADGGAVPLAITTLYNLSYTGNTSVTMSATDFVTGKVNNLALIAGTGKTITGLAGAMAIAGNLQVDALDALSLVNGGAQTLTLSSNTGAHVVNGAVTGGTVLVTGTGATLTGGNGTINASTVNDLRIAPATAGTFTSTGMKVLDPLTVNQTNLTASITMNTASATVNTFTNTAGTTTLNMNSTAVTATGDYTVTAGSVNLTMNDAAAATATIGGQLKVDGGTLTLGSNLWVTGAVTHDGSSIIALGAKNLTLADAYTHNNTASFTASTGKVVAAPAVAKNYTMTTAGTIPNFEINGAGTVTLQSAGLTVSNAYTQTAGTLDLNSLPLTLSGNTVTFTAGGLNNTGAAATGVVNLTGTAMTIGGVGNPTIPYVTLNTTGTVTVAANTTGANPVARTISISQLFTQTKGALVLGINNVAFTGGTGFAFTAGSISATTGEFQFTGAGGFTPGTLSSLTIPNLNIGATTTVAGTDTFHVSQKLTFGTGGNLGLSADGRLILDNGAAVVVNDNVGILSNKVQMAGVIDLSYVNATAAKTITTGFELPTTASALRNLTINMSGPGSVVLAANDTVNGTLALTAGTLNLTANSKKTILAAGATVNVKNGAINAPVTPAGAYALTYSGNNITTTSNEWPSTATISALTTNLANSQTLTLAASRTVGAFTLNNGNNTAALDLNGNTLTVTGLATLTKGTVTTGVANGTLVTQGDVNAAGASFGGSMQMAFTGATNQTITVPSGGASVGNITINKSSGANKVKIMGGDLTCSGTVTFTNGLIVTDTTTATATSLVLTNVPGTTGLGFTHNVVAPAVSHVVGNVKQNIKFAPAVAFARNEFPVGDTVNYRPAALTFLVPGSTAANYGINVTVSENSTKPTGKAGLPIADGIAPGVAIAGYPSFFWAIKADGSFGATSFNLELTAAGANPAEVSLTDVGANQVKMIRRGGSASDVQNIWNLQGVSSSYDNIVVNGVPTVTAVNAVGGLSTGGAIFTYGLKSNLVVLNPISAQTLTAGNAASIVKLSAPAVFGGNVGAIVYTASSSNTSIATVSVSNDTLKVTPVAAGTAVITVTGTDNNGFISTTFNVTVNAGAVAVSGKVVYDNATTTGIGRATVTLTPTTGTALTVTADTAGAFSFPNVQAGSYTLTASKTGTWAGANATDALQAVRAFAGLQTLDALATAAADVNNSGSVNATDALLIVQRFAGVTTSFAKGDWTFASVPVTVATTNMTGLQVKGLAVGDVNKSDLPTNGGSFQKTISGDISINSAKVTNVAAKAAFEIPVSVDNAMTLGAVSLKVNYPADLVSFEGVSSSKLSGVVANAADGVITIGWATMDAKAVSVKENEVLVSLAFAPKVDKGSVVLTTGAGEFADAEGNTLSLAKLSANDVEIGGVPSTFELAQNFPNPFNPSTEIQYSLAAAGKVTLGIYNVMGQEVSRLVSGQQEAGVYRVQWNASNMASGVYIYRLQVDGKFTASKRLMLLK